MKSVRLMIVVLALIAGACGGGDDTSSAGLPANTGDEPALDATCLVGEPDCQDIPGQNLADEDNKPQDLPSGDDTSTGMLVDGGLTVAEALAPDVTGVIAVQGFVVSDANGTRICDALAESYPPQCGGASLLLSSLDTVDPDALSSEGSVKWTDDAVTILGEISDGALIPTPLSQ
jgi:hypothetical protein